MDTHLILATVLFCQCMMDYITGLFSVLTCLKKSLTACTFVAVKIGYC